MTGEAGEGVGRRGQTRNLKGGDSRLTPSSSENRGEHRLSEFLFSGVEEKDEKRKKVWLKLNHS